MKKVLIFLFASAVVHSTFSQDSLVLQFPDYLNMVKLYHPVAKQAKLKVDIGKATLRTARGEFDPVIESGYDRKEFEGTQYWERLGATLKIPTWYGLELKGNLEQNSGNFINPSEFVPEDGLYSVGVRWEVGLMNQRMATLKQAKLFRDQTIAERDLAVNNILYKASIAYFNWLKSYRDLQIFDRFVTNARFRLQAVKTQVNSGDLAAIDSVEARIALNNRIVKREQAAVSLLKSRLEVSNFLWAENEVPLELTANSRPDLFPGEEIESVFELNSFSLDSLDFQDHPMLNSMQLDIDQFRVEQRLKMNQLLPRISVEYNILTPEPTIIDSFRTENYKGAIGVKFPLFLRKERGELQLARYKLRDAEWALDIAEVSLENRIRTLLFQWQSLEEQLELIDLVVTDYRQLLDGEERKFQEGESSLFLVNSRERQFIDAELELNSIRYILQETKADIFRVMGTNPDTGQP